MAVSRDQELRNAVGAARSQVRALERTARATARLLADLDERLGVELAQPHEEAQRNGYENEARGRVRA